MQSSSLSSSQSTRPKRTRIVPERLRDEEEAPRSQPAQRMSNNRRQNANFDARDDGEEVDGEARADDEGAIFGDGEAINDGDEAVASADGAAVVVEDVDERAEAIGEDDLPVGGEPVDETARKLANAEWSEMYWMI